MERPNLKKTEIWAVKIYFRKYRGYSECKRTGMLVIFLQAGSLFKICYKNALGEGFGKLRHFQISLLLS